jgi:hypothetical protein
MAKVFDTWPPYQPEWTEEDGDPFVKIDNITEDSINKKEDDKQATIDRKISNAKARAVDSIDWLPHELKGLINEHAPKPDDIVAGIVNKDWLEEEATKLFSNLKTNWTFINIYQLKAVANQFGDLWGFLVTISNKWYLKCFYAKSSTKPHESKVSPGKQRVLTSVKNGCGFVIKSVPHPAKCATSE